MTTADTETDLQRLLAATGPQADWDAASGNPLQSWLTGPASILQVLDDLCRDTDGGPGWSVLLDVDRCPTYGLPWLAQMVGVRVNPNDSDAAQRAAIRDEQGFGRGTPAAITTAAQKFLTGTKTVTVAERDTDAYHFTVTVYSAEVQGMSYAQLSAAYATYADLNAAFATYGDYASAVGQITDAVQAAKPAGLLCTVTVANGSPP